MPAIGRVVALYRYAVKSMGGEPLREAHVGERGIPGDRGWALRGKDGKAASAKRFADLMLASAVYETAPREGEVPPAKITLPDGGELSTSDGDASSRLSDWLGEKFRLVPAEGMNFDDLPLHVLTTASLKTMERLAPGLGWDARRFRPNVVVEPIEGADAHEGFPELGWLGDLRIGKADILVKKPCKRCVMTTHLQADLPKQPEILQALVDHADAAFGVYGAVMTPGRVDVGDLVERI